MNPESFWQVFNWLDAVLAVGLLAAFLVGLGAGFYRQVAITVSLIDGLLVASQFTQPLAATELWTPVHAKLGTSGAEATAYAAIILVSLLAGLLSILVFRSYFGRTLRFLDSVLGGGTGICIGGLVFGLIILGVFHWPETALHSPIRESYLGSRLAEGAKAVSKVFPEDFRQRVEASLENKLIDLADGEAAPAPALHKDTNRRPVNSKDQR